MKKTVLITGGSGIIGKVLRSALADNYSICTLSRKPIPGSESIAADIQHLDAMVQACQGIDSIVHMAAQSYPHAPWDEILGANIVGTYNIYEAARRAGVKQVIYASSNHAIAGYEADHEPHIYSTGQPLLDHKVPFRPDSFYGVSKGFGETLGRYYSDYHNIRVINLRIGWVNTQDTPFLRGVGESRQRLAAIWLSQRDCVQLIEKSLQADHVLFDTFYGISKNTPRFYDIEHAESILGYVPQDGADVSRAHDESLWDKPYPPQN